jgi:hypothetical protein
MWRRGDIDAAILIFLQNRLVPGHGFVASTGDGARLAGAALEGNRPRDPEKQAADRETSTARRKDSRIGI